MGVISIEMVFDRVLRDDMSQEELYKESKRSGFLKTEILRKNTKKDSRKMKLEFWMETAWKPR